MYQLTRKSRQPNYSYETKALGLTRPLIANDCQKMQENSCLLTSIHIHGPVSWSNEVAKRSSHGKPKANILLPVYCSHIELYYVSESSPVASVC